MTFVVRSHRHEKPLSLTLLPLGRPMGTATLDPYCFLDFKPTVKSKAVVCVCGGPVYTLKGEREFPSALCRWLQPPS